MAELTKTDLMFFQNEFLGDIKKLELKIYNKIDSSNNELKEKVINIENNIKTLSDKYEELFVLFNENKEKNEEIDKLNQFKSKIDEITSKNASKIEQLEKDIEDSNFKFDKIFDMNLTLPGIIGTEKCKYKNLRDFLDYANKSINLLLTNKDKNIIDFRGYKDKLETTIKNFNLQIDNVTNKYKEFCSNSVKHCESQFEKRINETEEKIQDLRIENNKFSNDLLSESEKFHLDYNNLQEYKNSLETLYNDKLKKQEELFHEFEKKFHNNEKDYKLIKQRFTELSDFIKSVRFRKNLGEVVKVQDFRDMSQKIDFKKKQKLIEEGVYDYYNIEGIKIPDFLNTIDDEQSLKKIEDSKINKNDIFEQRDYSGKSHEIISNQPYILNNSKTQIKNYVEQRPNHKKQLSENLPYVNINSDPNRSNKDEPFLILNTNFSFADNSYNQSKFMINNAVDNNKEIIHSRNKFYVPKTNSASNINVNNLDDNKINILFNSNSNQNIMNNKLLEYKKNENIQKNDYNNNIKKKDFTIQKKNIPQNFEMKKLLMTTDLLSKISNKIETEEQNNKNNQINKNKINSPEKLRKIRIKNNSMDINMELNGNRTSRELNEVINCLSSKFKFIKKNNSPTNTSQNNLYNSSLNIHAKNINEINDYKTNNNNKVLVDEISNKNLNEYHEHLKLVSLKEENKKMSKVNMKKNINNVLINGQNSLNQIKEEEILNSKYVRNQKNKNTKNNEKKDNENYSNSKIRLLSQNEYFDKKYCTAQINHFTPLNKLLENKSSIIPNDRKNILLKNLDPIMDKNFPNN